MRSVDVSTLSGRLSECVRLAAAGETVLITERDRVVAEIGPPREAVRKGWLTPSVMSAGWTPPQPEPVAPLDELLTELQDDRAEGG